MADLVRGRFCSPRLLASGSPVVAASRRTLLGTDPVGYAGCCAAIRDLDETATIGKIQTPVLIISGDLDVALPWKGQGDILARGIVAARVVHLPAAHLSNIETPRAFSAALLDFLVPGPTEGRDAGTDVRRTVLGDAHAGPALHDRDAADLD